jgi:GT2 family glycosyltransferase
MVNIVIGIITYKRLVGLKALIDSLNGLEVPDDCKLSILVVDNAEEFEVKKYIDDCKSNIEISYVVEPKKGIPYARNRIIDSVSKLTDFIIMVDDDEIVRKQWLIELLKCQDKYNASAVLGKVKPIFETTKCEFINDYFTKDPYDDGEDVFFGSTCNVLVRYKDIVSLGLRFDERMRFTGGSDTLFFLKLVESGCIFKYSKLAIVDEFIPENRANFSWIRQRAYREGTTFILSYRFFNGKSILFFSKQFVYSCASLIFLFPLYFSERLLGRCTKYSLQFKRRLGVLSSLFGCKYEEYK